MSFQNFYFFQQLYICLKTCIWTCLWLSTFTYNDVWAYLHHLMSLRQMIGFNL